MDRFDGMKAFVTAVDEGGFAAAGRELGLSRVQVSRLVIALEDHLKTQLLVRTTRTMELSDAGQVFLERARRLVKAMEEAEASAGDVSTELGGHLKVSAPMSLGPDYIAPLMSEFISRHKGARASLSVNDRRVDPGEEGFDVSLHIGEVSLPDLIVRKICPIRQIMCASPAYLDTNPPPRTPEGLSDHGILHHGSMDNDVEWHLRGVQPGKRLVMTAVFSSNDANAVKAACVAGHGIALLPAYAVANEMASGALLPVLEGFEPAPVPLNALYPSSHYQLATARGFVDFLTEKFGKRPPGGPV